MQKNLEGSNFEEKGKLSFCVCCKMDLESMYSIGMPSYLDEYISHTEELGEKQNSLDPCPTNESGSCSLDGMIVDFTPCSNQDVMNDDKENKFASLSHDNGVNVKDEERGSSVIDHQCALIQSLEKLNSVPQCSTVQSHLMLDARRKRSHTCEQYLECSSKKIRSHSENSKPDLKTRNVGKLQDSHKIFTNDEFISKDTDTGINNTNINGTKRSSSPSNTETLKINHVTNSKTSTSVTSDTLSISSDDILKSFEVSNTLEKPVPEVDCDRIRTRILNRRKRILNLANRLSQLSSCISNIHRALIVEEDNEAKSSFFGKHDKKTEECANKSNINSRDLCAVKNETQASLIYNYNPLHSDQNNSNNLNKYKT